MLMISSMLTAAMALEWNPCPYRNSPVTFSCNYGRTACDANGYVKKYGGCSESNASMFVSLSPDMASSGRLIVHVQNTNLRKLQPLT
jgi:hypothetical protein